MGFPEWFQELAKKVSNKGRWGEADELGTLNLITPEATLRGVGTVKRGESFSLAIPLDREGPQTGRIPNRINPLHSMIGINTPFTGDPDKTCLSDDIISMGTQAATHWDALSHGSYAGTMYNDHPSAMIRAETGAMVCGIEKVKTLVTRGVLLDLARFKGRERLEPGLVITPELLEDCLQSTGLTIESGDVLLVRTGHITNLDIGDRDAYRVPAPGFGVQSTLWFKEKNLAAVANDTIAFEVWPGEDPATLFPVHMLNLVDAGLTQGQNWQLEQLAEDCAKDGVYEFLLSATPEPIVGGTGAPVNPVATK
jgi:kynurenine formamidase